MRGDAKSSTQQASQWSVLAGPLFTAPRWQTPVRAALVKPEQTESHQRNLLAAASLTGSRKKIYALLSSDEPKPIDDLVESTGLNSSDVLATLFQLEMQGFVRQLPGKLFSKVLL